MPAGAQTGRRRVRTLPEPQLIALTTEALAVGKIVGWYQGRKELSSRALGNRSILADPRRLEVKDILNARKHREPFRPFAPSILEEAIADEQTSPILATTRRSNGGLNA